MLLAAAGPTFRLAEASPSPLLSASQPVQAVPPFEFGLFSLGFWYVPSTSLFVFATTQSVLGYSGDSEKLVRVSALGCADPGYEPYFPGSGENVYLQCRFPHYSEVSVFNTSTFQYTQNITVDFSGSYWFETLDARHQLLYCYGSDDALRTLDLRTGMEVANVTVPGGPPRGAWYDPSAGRLLVGNGANGSVLVVDPTTGKPMGSVAGPSNGVVIALVADPGAGRLYAEFTSQSAGQDVPPAETVVYDSSTLAQIATYGSVILGDALIDDSHHQAYFLEYSNGAPLVAAVSLTSFAPIQSNLRIPGAGSFPHLAYDPANDTFGGAGAEGGTPYISFMHVVRTMVESPPFSAMLLVGASFPVVVGAVGFAAGVGVLVARSLLRGREAFLSGASPDDEWLDDPAEGRE